MKKIIYIFLALLLLFLGGCAAYAVLNSTPSTDDPAFTEPASKADSDAPVLTEESMITTNPSDTETVTETATEAETVTEAITEAPSVTDAPDEAPPVTEPPVTEPPLPPIDYTDLAGEYGFQPDTDPNRTWAELSDGEEADPAKPMIALTFDDGPGVHTERLLGILAENNAKATFFVAGSRIEGREHIVKGITDGGHDIGGHSWWHSDLTKLSERAVADEIMMTRERIYAATGVDSRLVRPPYGAYNEFVRWVGEQVGVVFVNWNVDTVDWKTRNADEVYDSVVGSAKDGAVILCHDIHQSTVDAMERAIPKLIEDGYQLVSVSELMTHSANAFVPGKVYNRK